MREYVVLDVFTDVPLQGNPVAVFTDAAGLPSEVMQRTARELNLSETVFLLAPEDDSADASMRIFTPSAELPFAGHPVLGAAVLVGQRRDCEVVRLRTRAGVIPVALTRVGEVVADGEMEQPVPTVEPVSRPEAVLRALGVGPSRVPVEAYRNGPVHVYVMVDSPEEVAGLEPDLGALERLGAIGVSCFALSGGAVKTRMFAPGLGVPEDPATGSAAGPLALHLARHGLIAFGKEIAIAQGEEIGRPSRLRARVEGSPSMIERVVVGGPAVLVALGRYRLG